MSLTDPGSGGAPVGGAGGNSGGSMFLTVAQNIVSAINRLSTVMSTTFPRITGTFTLTAAATTTVTQPGVKATSVIVPIPTNASAATLEGSAKKLYISAIVPGTSFTVATGNAAAAAGTETFSYAVFGPS